MGQYKFKINGKDYEVAVNSIEGKNASVTVNGVDYSVEMENAASGIGSAAPAIEKVAQTTAQQTPENKVAEQQNNQAGDAKGGKKISSPLPGVIIEVCVKEGQAVKRGDKIAVLEAMKMENDILSDTDGTVSAIHVTKGDSVLEGADIASIA